GQHGDVTYSLTVSPINQWRIGESSPVATQLEEGEIFAAHPQISANAYWENYREIIGTDQADHMAEMPFFLGDEVVTIHQVLFRYKVEPVLAVTKSYTLEGAETDLNDAEDTGATAATIDNETVTIGTTAATINNTTATVDN